MIPPPAYLLTFYLAHTSVLLCPWLYIFPHDVIGTNLTAIVMHVRGPCKYCGPVLSSCLVEHVEKKKVSFKEKKRTQKLPVAAKNLKITSSAVF